MICTLGHAGWAEQIKIIDAALAAGVKRFIPSEFGSDTLNPNIVELFSPALAVKVSILEYLRANEGRMSWTGIATGAFFDFVGYSLPLPCLNTCYCLFLSFICGIDE